MPELEGEGHVVVNCHVRVERIVLEDHRDVAILGGDVVDDLAVDDHLALAYLLQAGYHAQSRGLAAAGGTDEHDELLVSDVDVEVLHRYDALVGDLKVDLALLDGLLTLLFLFLLTGGVGVDFLYVFEDYL